MAERMLSNNNKRQFKMTKIYIEYNQNYVGDLKLPVLRYSNYNLENINFKPLGVRVLRLFSNKFKNYFGRNSFKFKGQGLYHNNTIFFRDIVNDNPDEDFFVVVPIRIVQKKDFTKDNELLLQAYEILQIAYPSKLYIRYKVLFSVESGLLNQSTLEEFPFKSKYAHPRHVLSLNGSDSINQLIKRYATYEIKNFFRTALDIYLYSFDMHHFSMQFLNLIMCLESSVDGPQELSYRLRRGMAIICGIDDSSCQLIYSNITKVYLTRSKIVHGEQTFNVIIHKHIPYLIDLASKFLKELILHNIFDKKTLNKRLNSIGYGDNHKLSNNYSSLIIDKEIEDNIMTAVLRK